MRMMSCMAALLLLAGLGSMAHARTEARLTLSDFKVLLTDLDAADAYTPTLEWRGTPLLRMVSTDWVQLGWEPVAGSSPTVWQQVWDRQPGSSQTNQVSRVLELSGPSVLGYGQLHVQGTGQGLGQLSLGYATDGGLDASADAWLYQNFVLSPGTQATFSVLFSGEALGRGDQQDGGWSTIESNNYIGGRSTAHAQVYMVVGGLRTGMNISGYASLGEGHPYDWSVDQVLTLSIRNETQTAQTYGFSVDGSLMIYESSLPVPEPGSVLMISVGLVALGALAKRRRGRPS